MAVVCAQQPIPNQARCIARDSFSVALSDVAPMLTAIARAGAWRGPGATSFRNAAERQSAKERPWLWRQAAGWLRWPRRWWRVGYRGCRAQVAQHVVRGSARHWRVRPGARFRRPAVRGVRALAPGVRRAVPRSSSRPGPGAPTGPSSAPCMARSGARRGRVRRYRGARRARRRAGSAGGPDGVARAPSPWSAAAKRLNSTPRSRAGTPLKGRVGERPAPRRRPPRQWQREGDVAAVQRLVDAEAHVAGSGLPH